MKSWEVTYFESGKGVVTVLIRDAASASKAQSKADTVCPHGAHLTTKRYFRCES